MTKKTKTKAKNFLALDTETYKGKAFLLSCPTRVFRLREFADFLLALSTFDTQKFVFYNIDYDVSALVKHLPRAVAGRIYLNRDVVLSESLTLRYIPGKVFRITFEGVRYECFDLLPFFQRSLDSVSAEYLGKRKQELPKELLEDLSPRNYLSHKELVDSYAIRDAQLLQELTDKFYLSVQSTGLKVSSLYSPGYLAKRYLGHRNIFVTPNPVELLRVSNLVYYGGRIEVAQRGYFPHSVIFDLKSAYPWALRDLPDIGSARHYVSDKPETKYYLAEVVAPIPPEGIVSPFAQRKDALVLYPNLSEGSLWVTSAEFESTKADARRFLNFETNAKRPYQKLVDDLFSLRSTGGMESLVYKLILNSLYGILAEKRVEYKVVALEDAVQHLQKQHVKDATQLFITIASQQCPEAGRSFLRKCNCDWCAVVRFASRRASRMPDQRMLTFEQEFYQTREKSGRKSNKLLAAFVTGIVRAEVFKMAKLAGPSFIGCFTDSLLLRERVELPVRNGLGMWEEKYEGPLWVVGSGVYETLEYTKFRGYRVPIGYLRTLLERMDNSTINIPQRDRQSLGKMVRLSYQDYESFNVIKDVDKKFDLNFDRKRQWPAPFENGAQVLSTIQTSIPLSAGAFPYSDIGF